MILAAGPLMYLLYTPDVAVVPTTARQGAFCGETGSTASTTNTPGHMR